MPTRIGRAIEFRLSQFYRRNRRSISSVSERALIERALIENSNPDILLLDVGMPILNRYDGSWLTHQTMYPSSI